MAESGPDHPLLVAVEPLLRRVDAQLVTPAQAREGDVPLVWDGDVVAAVRLPQAPGSLERLLADVAAELGAPLDQLPREGKQRAVRLLEERNAFEYRRSAEIVAEALGVTRFTVYNYLNRTS
jgi:hypothetical protein